MTQATASRVEALVAQLRQMGISGLCSDTRKIQAGQVFVAWPGVANDPRRHVRAAMDAGAGLAVVEADGAEAYAPAWADCTDRVVAVAGLQSLCGELAAAFYQHPSRHMAVLAVTGTNGKTSVSWWLAQAINALAQKTVCGVVGTLGMGDGNGWVETGLTTPDPVALQAQWRAWSDAGLTHCAIEASSIGLQEQRLAGAQLHTAIWTNLTQDHLDYHGTMEAYFEAKQKLMRWPGLSALVINVDDAAGQRLAGDVQTRQTHGLAVPELWTCSQTQAARLQAHKVQVSTRGLRFEVLEQMPGGSHEAVSVEVPFFGPYNIDNLLLVMAALRAQGHALQAIAGCLAQLKPVPGRLEWVNSDAGVQHEPRVFVDYAHTPDALSKTLDALRPLAVQSQGRLWCVLGCGGNRDAGKRPLMAQQAQALADQVVLTSDNPRKESPQRIVDDMCQGLSTREGVAIELDRAQAIAHALNNADANDVVLVAGKGHESYQDVDDVKKPFSDTVQCRLALRARQQAHASQAQRPPMGLAATWVTACLAAQGAQVQGSQDRVFARIHTDSRTVLPGDLFIALRGDQFDGAKFIPMALEQGASGIVVHADATLAVHHDVPVWRVQDTRAALGQLAAAWRKQFNLALVAVTGSNGKTTVTQMLAGIFHAQDGRHHWATQGNLNNDIGVPLTLLGLRQTDRRAVVELGMNHPGEIAGLAAWTRPGIAVINNAQREHLEFMQSVEAVARENGSVIDALPAQGTVVIPVHDAYQAQWAARAGDRAVLRFGWDQADVTASDVVWAGDHWQFKLNTPLGTGPVQLHLAGRHNVLNATAAAAAACAAGVSLPAITQGLSAFVAVQGRSMMQTLRLGAHTLTLINDTYNANPDSVLAAIDVLKECQQPALLVLGDMGEVGSQGPEFHRQVGQYAAEVGIALFTHGPLSEHAQQAHGHAVHHSSLEALNAAVCRSATDYRSILIKGSRFMRMERVVQALLQHHKEFEHAA